MSRELVEECRLYVLNKVTVKCNHVIEINTEMPYHDLDGNHRGNLRFADMQKNNGGNAAAFKGEKVVTSSHGSYKTLLSTKDGSYYPRQMLLIKGVDYEE